MRLLRCHIENFGKLTDLTMDFEQGLNVICRENGWGKSTLAAFLKVMLYGFEEEKARDEFKNERKRFRPWQGGVYGGSLTFEANGRRYVLNRTFGAKEREDRFSLREADTNLESGDYSKRLGEELFSLDCNSFCRTVFVSQSDCETVSTDAVNAKIGNLAETADDINCFERANQRLANLLNQLSPARKTGALYRKKEELDRLRMSVRAGESVQTVLKEAQSRLAQNQKRQREIQQEQALLLEKQKEAAKKKELLAKRQTYEALCHSLRERQEAYAGERAYFPGQTPDAQTLGERIGESLELAAARESVKGKELTSQEREEREGLGRLFAQGTPERQKLLEWEEKARQLQEQRIALAESRPNPQEEARLLSYQSRFAAGTPRTEEVERLTEDWKRCLETQNALEQKRLYCLTLQELDEAEKEKEKKKGLGGWTGGILFLAGVLCLAAGLCLTVFGTESPLPGLGLAVAGAACLAAAWVGALKGKRKEGRRPPEQSSEPGEQSALERCKREIAQDEAFVGETKARMRDFLERYHIPWQREEEILDCLYGFKGEIREYIALSHGLDREKFRQRQEQLKRLSQEIQQFLSPYFPGVSLLETSYLSRLHELKEMADSYERLREKEKQYGQAAQDYNSRLNALEDYVRSLSMEPEPDQAAQLLRIQSHLQALEMSRREYQAAKEKKEAFWQREEGEGLLEQAPGEALEEPGAYADRIEELSLTLEQLYQTMAEENRRLLDLREEADRVEEEKKALEEMEREYQKEMERYRLLQRTRELLEQAKLSVTSRYTEPIRRSLRQYYTLLSGESGERLHVDANTKVTLDEQGMQRELVFFSAGCRDLLGVCLRMALVEAMYREEKPFVVFDDPFANLDEDKLAGGKKLLSGLAENYQVLYFTCHESRSRC